jgi:hypothetical protein
MKYKGREYQLKFNHRLPRLFPRTLKVIGISLGSTIYVPEESIDPYTLAHEVRHLQQMDEKGGTVIFVTKYLSILGLRFFAHVISLGNLCKRPYLDHPYEKDAERFAKLHWTEFKALRAEKPTGTYKKG